MDIATCLWFPLGFSQNTKNFTTISLLFGALGFSCRLSYLGVQNYTIKYIFKY
jgi:threonine/homoserine efflux transporter RhtA